MSSEDKRWIVALCIVILATLALGIAMNVLQQWFDV